MGGKQIDVKKSGGSEGGVGGVVCGEDQPPPGGEKWRESER